MSQKSQVIQKFVKFPTLTLPGRRKKTLAEVVQHLEPEQGVQFRNQLSTFKEVEFLTNSHYFMGSGNASIKSDVPDGDALWSLSGEQSSEYVEIKGISNLGNMSLETTTTFDGDLSFFNCRFVKHLKPFAGEHLDFNAPCIYFKGKGRLEFQNCIIEHIIIDSDALDVSFVNCKIGNLARGLSRINCRTLTINSSSFAYVTFNTVNEIQADGIISYGNVHFSSDARIHEWEFIPAESVSSHLNAIDDLDVKVITNLSIADDATVNIEWYKEPQPPLKTQLVCERFYLQSGRLIIHEGTFPLTDLTQLFDGDTSCEFDLPVELFWIDVSQNR